MTAGAIAPSHAGVDGVADQLVTELPPPSGGGIQEVCRSRLVEQIEQRFDVAAMRRGQGRGVALGPHHRGRDERIRHRRRQSTETVQRPSPSPGSGTLSATVRSRCSAGGRRWHRPEQLGDEQRVPARPRPDEIDQALVRLDTGATDQRSDVVVLERRQLPHATTCGALPRSRRRVAANRCSPVRIVATTRNGASTMAGPRWARSSTDATSAHCRSSITWSRGCSSRLCRTVGHAAP